MRALLPLVAAIFLIPFTAIAEPAVGDEASRAALADVVIEGFDPPVRLRLIVTQNGLPWQERFGQLQRQRVESLFQQLDANQDGRLTRDEAKRLPLSRSLGGRQEGREVNVAFNFLVLDANRDGGASLKELAEYFGSLGETPFELAQGVGEKAAKGPDLFNVLDVNHDGLLTKDERPDAPALFERDRDGNRVLTGDELRPSLAGAIGPEFVALPLARSAAKKPLVVKMAAAKAGPADVTATIRLGDSSPTSEKPPREAVEIAVSEEAQQRGVRVQRMENDLVAIEVQRRRVELRLVPGAIRRDALLRQALVREFEAAAERSGGKASAKDRLAPLLKSVFPVADGNADGALTRAELEKCLAGYVTASLDAEATRLRLTALEERGGLTSQVDRNLDGRLSVREMARLPQSLAACADEDGEVRRDHLPTTLSLVLQQGPFDEISGAEALLRSGPPWFFRADRNQDGDLDAREFFGSPELFRRIDANADGSLELKEALAADAMFSS